MSYIPSDRFDLAIQSEPRVEVALGATDTNWKQVERLIMRTIDRGILMYAWDCGNLIGHPSPSWDQYICEGSGHYEMIPPRGLAHRGFTLTASGLLSVRARPSKLSELEMELHAKGINLYIDNRSEPEQSGSAAELVVEYSFEVEVHPVGIKMAKVYLRDHAVTESDIHGPRRPNSQNSQGTEESSQS